MISAFQRFFTPHFFAPHLRLIYLFLWGGGDQRLVEALAVAMVKRNHLNLIGDLD